MTESNPNQPMSLEEFSAQVLKHKADEMARYIALDIESSSALLRFLCQDIEPPTRRQRIWWWITDHLEQISGAWKVLRGTHRATDE